MQACKDIQAAKSQCTFAFVHWLGICIAFENVLHRFIDRLQGGFFYIPGNAPLGHKEGLRKLIAALSCRLNKLLYKTIVCAQSNNSLSLIA